MIQSKKILVATDLGNASNAALEHGRAVAQSFGATLAVLHVANVISIGIGEAGGKFDEFNAKPTMPRGLKWTQCPRCVLAPWVT